uniref:Cysteine-rich venom protein n=1 Tax=Strigamia maritima TaxID=126957 RepID=T1JKW9_STRMM
MNCYLLLTNILSSGPKIYGNAIPQRDLETTYNNTQKKIVLYHNYFRTKVDPPAENMLQMKWSADAADGAQRWAEACQLLVHDNITGRWVPEFGSCGQNIFVANVQVPWFFAIQTWYLEKDNFTYDSETNDLEIVGHYTQLAWYSTHKVGCGFYYCNVGSRPYYNYVCNYCPIGNYPDRIGRPYDAGSPCGACNANACPYADLWMNCKEINATWHDWLCEEDEGANSQFCRATCQCSHN